MTQYHAGTIFRAKTDFLHYRGIDGNYYNINQNDLIILVKRCRSKWIVKINNGWMGYIRIIAVQNWLELVSSEQ